MTWGDDLRDQIRAEFRSAQRRRDGWVEDEANEDSDAGRPSADTRRGLGASLEERMVNEAGRVRKRVLVANRRQS